MRRRERDQALELLERHPGWSDRRVADAVGVSHTTIGRWRRAAGLPHSLKRVGRRRRR
jgi:transposase